MYSILCTVSRRSLVIATSFVVFMLSIGHVVIAAEFIPLGPLDAFELSDDGRKLVGEVDGEPVLWTDEQGIVGLGYSRQGDAFGKAEAISGDGNVVVGFSGNGPDIEAFRWTAESGLTTLGKSVDGLATRTTAVSNDGTMIVGRTLPFQAWYWTEDEGVVNISQEQSISRDVSADGAVVVGDELNAATGTNRAFRWTRDGGIQLFEPPADLDFIAIQHQAHGVSADGSKIVVRAWDTNSVPTSYLWEGDATKLIGRDAPVGTTGFAEKISNSGIAAGSMKTGGAAEIAAIWNENNGWSELPEVLMNHYELRDSLDGWQLTRIRDISPDGRFMLGNGTNPDGEGEDWLVRLDHPFLGTPIVGDFNGDKVVDVKDLNALGVAIRHNSDDAEFDLDESTDLASGDIIVMVETVLGTWIGDSNLDGEFNSRDLVTVFQSSQYEDSIDGNSNWETGDWNLDGDFTTADLVFAFQDGGYEKGPRSAPVAVPEPGTLTSILIGLFFLIRLPANDRVSHCSL